MRRSLFVLALLIACAGSVHAAIAPPPASTRKVVLEKSDAGYRWRLVEAPVPALGEHQVLVQMRAVALNRGDLEILEPDPSHDRSGLVAASDAAGDVVAIGRNVRSARIGQRVTSTYFQDWADGPPSREKLSKAHGASVDGVFGDLIVLEENAVVPAPRSLSYEEASTLPTAGLTAWMASVGQGNLRKGDVVLVQGTGGVSTFATQFAAAIGARVIVTSSSDDKMLRAKSFGASDGINYRTTPAWSDRVLEITAGHGADLVVDVGGKATLEQSVRSLAYWGTLSIVGGLSGYDGTVPAADLLLRTARAQGVFVGSRADFLRMNAFIEAHKLHPVIDRVFAFADRDAALKTLAAGNFVGKIVIRIDATP